MASTSDTTVQYDPFEQVTPFFNRAQIFAFSQAPSADAIKKVNRGGSHEYIPHEYIRALLDRFIGPGRWEMKAAVHTIEKEVVTKNGKDQVAATAVVNVEIAILAKDDPNNRLTFGGIGSHTMYAAVEQGFGSVVGNAIDSAESDGVKAAAKNLGKAFGFDLKGKLNRNVLPPSITQYANILAERHGRNAPQASLPAPAAAEAPAAASEQVPVQQVAQAPKVEAAKPREEPVARPNTERAPQANTKAPEPAAEQQKPKPVDKTAEAPRAVQSVEPASEAAVAETKPAAQWELSMDPGTDFANWLACLQTMAARITAMTSAREIESFVKRYSKRIKDLPQIPAKEARPAQNGQPAQEAQNAKDFKARFRKIVARKYVELGLEVPEQYAEPAPVAA